MRARDLSAREQDIDLAVRRVLNTSDGQHFQQLLIDDYMLDQVHTPGDPYQTAFGDGQRSVAARLLRIANEEPQQ